MGERTIYYSKKKDSDKIWWVEYLDFDEEGICIPSMGPMRFTFDKKKIFTLKDYPNNLTKEQKEIFDKENPFWAKRLRNRK